MTQREPDRYLLRCPRWSLGCGCGCGCGGGARVKRGRSSNTPSIHVPRFARVCEWCARACAVKSSGAAPVHQGPQFMHLGVCTPKPPRPLGRWIAPALPRPTTRESRYPQPDPLGICTPICCVGPSSASVPVRCPGPDAPGVATRPLAYVSTLLSFAFSSQHQRSTDTLRFSQPAR